MGLEKEMASQQWGKATGRFRLDLILAIPPDVIFGMSPVIGVGVEWGGGRYYQKVYTYIYVYIYGKDGGREKVGHKGSFVRAPNMEIPLQSPNEFCTHLCLKG